MADAAVIKLDTERWEKVADLARWLLTHADEYDCAIVSIWNRSDGEKGTKNAEILTVACPQMPIPEALGILEVAKSVYIDTFWGRQDHKASGGRPS